MRKKVKILYQVNEKNPKIMILHTQKRRLRQILKYALLKIANNIDLRSMKKFSLYLEFLEIKNGGESHDVDIYEYKRVCGRFEKARN